MSWIIDVVAGILIGFWIGMQYYAYLIRRELRRKLAAIERSMEEQKKYATYRKFGPLKKPVDGA
jgi:membrane-associated phospholipid phosphatase